MVPTRTTEVVVRTYFWRSALNVRHYFPSFARSAFVLDSDLLRSAFSECFHTTMFVVDAATGWRTPTSDTESCLYK